MKNSLVAGVAILLVLSTATCTGQPSPAVPSQDYAGTALDRPAADFRLTDHKSAVVALSDFWGQVVVLTFMDSKCKEICPLTAAQLRQAYSDLGAEAASVVFIGINVNVEAKSVADVKAPTKQWRLDEIPTWHFLTGSADELEPVWKAYGVAVLPAPEGGEIAHTPGVYLIDQKGRLRWYISTPYDEAGTPQWTMPLNELLVNHIRELWSEK